MTFSVGFGVFGVSSYCDVRLVLAFWASHNHVPRYSHNIGGEHLYAYPLIVIISGPRGFYFVF